MSAMSPRSPVAVVGMHGRFPGAADLQGFWHNQLAGRDGIQPVPAERWDWQAIAEDSGVEESSYSHHGGFMPAVDRFDHRLFGILPREAQIMDPQQRLFLQAAWGALEDAGHAPSSLAGRRVGVFVGVGHADYPALMRRDGVPCDAWRGTGIALTAIANRVSFALDLHGPSESVDTACSSSLVAIHRAVQALQDGECELAIVGGVNLLLAPELFIAFSKAGMLSRSGRCHTFDAGADGYVRGEGVAALVLAPLQRARDNGDFIYGEICGSAVNHGGRAHSFTAPNPGAQAEVIGKAWQQSGHPLQQAAFIETHGTGTPLGDPIEINALKLALEQAPALDAPTAPIQLAALKSHIGHLEAAAGIASVVRALLCLQHGQLIGNLHYQQPSPHLQLAGSPLQILASSQPLTAPAQTPLLAGVSSFGFGGVNAHVVLRAHPAQPIADSAPAPWLFPLSARTRPALLARIQQLRTALEPVAAERLPLLQRLCQTLGLPADAVDDQQTLHSLGLSATRLMARLQPLLPAGSEPALWRDAVTLGELADRLLAAPLPASEAHGGSQPVIPAALLASASAGSIARSLLEGRNAMQQRVAFVACSREELLAQLTDYLQQADTPAASASTGMDSNPAETLPGTLVHLQEQALRWASSRQPHPDWHSLYGERPRPALIPLPAYPFALDRVWYSAQPATSNVPPASAPVGVPTAAARTVAVQPDSLPALVALLQQSSSTHRWQQWRDLQFAAPRAVADVQALGCRHTQSCVQVQAADLVLLQALEQNGEQPLLPSLLASGTAAVLDGSALQAALQTLGLGHSHAVRQLTQVQATRQHLQARLQLTTDRNSPAFWPELLGTLSAALAYLAHEGARLPWRIQRLLLQPAAIGQAQQLRVQRDGPQLQLQLLDAAGQLLLAMEGVQLRRWSPDQLLEKSA